MSESGNLTFIDPQAELRKRYLVIRKVRAKQRAMLLARGVRDVTVESLLTPTEWTMFTDLACGAKGKRTGKPCALTTIYSNTRCKFHGGLSTGPTTAKGRAKSGRNGVGKVQAADAATGLA